MKKIIAIGGFEDLFLYYLRILDKYPNKEEVLLYYTDKNFQLYNKLYGMFLSMQKIKYQLFNITKDELLEYNKNYDYLIEDQNVNNDKIEIKIDLNNFNLHLPTNVITEFLEKKSKLVVVQLSTIYPNKNKIIWDDEILELFLNTFPNIVFIGADTIYTHKNNFTYMSMIDQFHLIKHAKLFIGENSIYSYYAAMLSIPQILHKTKKNLYFFNWGNLLHFSETNETLKNLIIDYGRKN
jgi:hypothetical protein